MPLSLHLAKLSTTWMRRTLMGAAQSRKDLLLDFRPMATKGVAPQSQRKRKTHPDRATMEMLHWNRME